MVRRSSVHGSGAFTQLSGKAFGADMYLEACYSNEEYWVLIGVLFHKAGRLVGSHAVQRLARKDAQALSRRRLFMVTSSARRPSAEAENRRRFRLCQRQSMAACTWRQAPAGGCLVTPGHIEREGCECRRWLPHLSFLPSRHVCHCHQTGGRPTRSAARLGSPGVCLEQPHMVSVAGSSPLSPSHVARQLFTTWQGCGSRRAGMAMSLRQYTGENRPHSAASAHPGRLAAGSSASRGPEALAARRQPRHAMHSAHPTN